MNLKEIYKNLGVDTKVVADNATRLVEAVALIITAYYNYTSAHHAHLSGFEFKVRVAASVVIGLRGAWEFLRYLANKDKGAK